MKTACQSLALCVALLCCVPAAQAQKPRWVRTDTWTGHGTKGTDVFRVNSERWRIRYRTHSTNLFQIAVYDADSNVIDVAVDLRRGMPGFASMRGRGDRFLLITGIDMNWEVHVDQYLSVVEEWHLMQHRRQPRAELVRVGTWAGDETSARHRIDVPTRMWKLVYGNAGPGFVRVTVTDSEGKVVFAGAVTGTGEKETWIHRAGTFELEINADDADWKVDVLSEPF